MPELAEVEHSRQQWNAGLGQTVLEVVIARPEIRVFRGTDVGTMRETLAGRKLLRSEARGKQMLFAFSDGAWLGLHLGMSGELRHEAQPDFVPRKHDHLILRHAAGALVFQDQRHFGRVRLHHGPQPPDWWANLAQSVLSAEFSAARLATFLQRRRRSPLKAVLLLQEHFPGVGNWMADEILWRARLHPGTPAGALDEAQTRTLWQQVRRVSQTAIRVISEQWTYPKTWLFTHRWEAGGKCPRCKEKLDRATIGGRTTCWCPRCQPASDAQPATDAARKASRLEVPLAKRDRANHQKRHV